MPNPTIFILIEKLKQSLLLTVQELQATRYKQIAKKYNAAHFIYTFKVRDIITIAIPTKDQVVSDTFRIELYIIDILHKNWHTLETDYSILKNSYSISELN